MMSRQNISLLTLLAGVWMAVIRSFCKASTSSYLHGWSISVEERNHTSISGYCSGPAPSSSVAWKKKKKTRTGTGTPPGKVFLDSPIEVCPRGQGYKSDGNLASIRVERSSSRKRRWGSVIRGLLGDKYTGAGVHARLDILSSSWSRGGRNTSSTAELSGKRGFCSNAVGAGSVIGWEGEMEVMEGDVVEYPEAAAADMGEEGEDDNETRKRVGVIVDLYTESNAIICHIEPLCQEDPGSKEWIHDEFQPEVSVPVGQVRVLQAWYNQRMVPDRISNPHGEHAENLWIIE